MQIIIKASRQFGRTTFLVNELLSYIKDEQDINVLVITPVKNAANNFQSLILKHASEEPGYVHQYVVSSGKIILNDNIIRVIPCFDFSKKVADLSFYDIVVVDDADKCDIEVMEKIHAFVKQNPKKLILMSEEEK